jgi:hypothetical protein
MCHKEVSAVRIAGVENGADGSLTLHLEGGFPDVVFSHEETKRRQKPEAGWYLVVYADGFKSFSPGKTFEEGYSPNGERAEPDGGNNIVAFESSLQWRRYAAALERELIAKGSEPPNCIASDDGRTVPPSNEEIEAETGELAEVAAKATG